MAFLRGNDFAIYAEALELASQALLMTLHHLMNCHCRRSTVVENLTHNTSFHASEKSAPSNAGTTHLAWRFGRVGLHDPGDPGAGERRSRPAVGAVFPAFAPQSRIDHIREGLPALLFQPSCEVGARRQWMAQFTYSMLSRCFIDLVMGARYGT